MSYSHDLKKQSNFPKELLIDFLMLNGYFGNMKMFTDVIELKKPNADATGENNVYVPNKKPSY